MKKRKVRHGTKDSVDTPNRKICQNDFSFHTESWGGKEVSEEGEEKGEG